MKRGRLLALGTVFVTAIAALLISSETVLISAQNQDREESPPPFYNPYPFGILPGDLPQEIDRVRREVRFIENEALAQWQALTPPTLTGQPPTLANTGMRANQLLGKLMNFDEHMLTLVANLHSLSLTNSTCLATLLPIPVASPEATKLLVTTQTRRHHPFIESIDKA